MLADQAVEALNHNRLADALKFALAATAKNARDAGAWEILAVAYYRLGLSAKAVQAATVSIDIDPSSAARHANLGAMLRATGRHDEAEKCYRAAIKTDPRFAPAHHNLGNLLADRNETLEAAQVFETAVALKADYGEAWHGLGIARQKLGDIANAIVALRTALQFMPKNAQAMSDLATCLMAGMESTEAHALLLAAIKLDPGFAAAHGNLGALLLQNGYTVAALGVQETAVGLVPAEHRWISNLAGMNKDLCRFSVSEDLYRRALALRPGYALGHSNLLFCLNYHPDKSAEDIFAEYRRFDDVHAKPHLPRDVRFDQTRDPERRLRVGYLSPDFREHAARHFIEPILSNHDPDVVELFCYAEVANPDDVTRRFQTIAQHWRSTAGLSDDAVAALIRQDKIDVLVDFGGHTAASRLLVMARRPAPIQIAHMLGHGYTSGLSAVDAFFADDALAPKGSEHLFAETVVRLPRIPISYQPPQGMPDVAPLPALANRHITFGYFGRPERLNDRVIETWARVLHAVPNSRLMLNSKAFTEPAFRGLMAGRFAANDIPANRLDLVFTTPQPKTWDAYGQIDIALDPFPHNAGTTTIEAIWLGVPVVSLRDRPSVGRFGDSILSAVGLRDWVGDTADDYVAIAKAKAADIHALAALRAKLRHDVQSSPLADHKGLTQSFENAFRSLWKKWCAKGEQTGEKAARKVAYQSAMPLDAAGRLTDAASVWQTHLAVYPDDADALMIASDLHRRLGALALSEAHARRALSVAPHSANAANALGNALAAQNKLTEAEGAFSTAVTIDPGKAEAFNNRALALMRRGQYAAAEHDLRRAQAARPDMIEISFNLANSLQDQGRITEAVATFKSTLTKAPANPTGHGMMLFSISYHPTLTADEIFAEFAQWNATHARQHGPKNPVWPNDRSTARRLKIGYVSPEFAHKSARHFIEPMLAKHDRAGFEVYCYAEVIAPDGETERLKRLADHWRSTVGLSDDALAALIRRDAIDVLIDLGGHTARNRLLALARKPAPVQIAHFLGHGYTSGLEVMDAFLADDKLAPAGSDALFSEPVVRLPRIPIAYAPPIDIPDVSELPAARRGYVTFGHFGRAVRLNEEVIAVWSRILHAIPTSRLVLNAASFADGEAVKRYGSMFAGHGIAAGRVDLIFTTPQPKTWAAYADIDIALDPFPHNGGTTTIEALWMGLASISLKARAPVGRFGETILSSVGLEDWVVGSVDDYVAKAVAAAHAIGDLAALRKTLRGRMQASPLCDGPGLTRCLEDTYLTLWERYVTREADIEAMQRDGAAAYGQGDYASAIASFRKALGVVRRADIVSNLGAALRASGQANEALAAYREAIERDPGSAAAHGNLGNLLLSAGHKAEAEAALSSALALEPQNPSAMRNLALCLIAQSKLETARDVLVRARDLAPDDPDVRDNLAQTLRQLGYPLAGATEYEARPQIFSASHRILSNAASLHQDLCRFSVSEDLYRRALALRPGYALGHSNLLFCLNYHPDKSAEDIFAEYRRFDDVHAKPHLPRDVRFDQTRDPERRLRVGYLSPDFREHAARHFIEPILSNHDPDVVELFCYAEVANPDDVTRRFQTIAQHWRSTAGLSDDAVAALIRQDKIDVLVDFGGHTAASRLLVMARRPAPIQIAHMLGHGYTSGLSAVDAFFADDALAPKGSEHLFAETVVRLPRIPISYQPPQGMPDVAPLPALANRHITFGYFGRPERLNDRVIETWARVLHAVPNSRLMLNSKAFTEPAFRGLMAGRFAANDIPANRLDLVFTTPQPKTWDAYGQIDIALDPFPHNAGTTTIEAIWLGVPVVSLRDRPSVGRFGDSILSAVGLRDWVGDTADDYVAIAKAKAADIHALAALRAKLRHDVQSSPLADHKGLTQSFENAFRSLWKKWCAGAQRSLEDVFSDAIKAYERGDFEQVRALMTACLDRDASNGEFLHMRGIASYRLGRHAEAARDLEDAIRVAPARADWRWNFTAILRVLGRLPDAERQGQEAIRLAPNAAEAHNNLGSVLKDLGRIGEARQHFLTAAEIKPGYADAWSNLALALATAGQAKDAEAAARKALALAPCDANAWNHLGMALMLTDDLAEASRCFEKAVGLKPSFDTAHSNLLFCLNYRTDLTAQDIAAAYRDWDRAHAAPLMPSGRSHIADPNPARRLRVGYVSPDFRYHAASFFTEPMLAAHDRTNFEVFCYADVANPDAVTERFRDLADGWRSTIGMSHADVADLIRRDGIDILIDLAGHTAGNRLLALARRPAPIQIAHMVGSGMTTGMRAMDVFIADAALVPAEADALFSEAVMRLPRIPLVYSPPPGMPEVTPLPAAAKGHVTFGCFSRTARLNAGVIETWAAILSAVPAARLMLNSKPFQEAGARLEWQGRFAKHGIDPARLDLVYTSPQPDTWAAYGQIDIALDPFPHNAGTTTIEALWLGVPVVSLRDRPPVGRFGASILGSLGMDDWVADDRDQYIARAVEAASDIVALAALRQSLRKRFKASPLGGDAVRLTRELEAAYRQLWQQVCIEPRVQLARAMLG